MLVLPDTFRENDKSKVCDTLIAARLSVIHHTFLKYMYCIDFFAIDAILVDF